MSRFGKSIVFAFLLLAAPAAACGGAGPTALSGTWKKLPNAPIATDGGAAAAWTGKQLIVYGRHGTADVAAAFDPASETWTKLVTPGGRAGAWSAPRALWTGKELLLLSPFGSYAFDPAARAWRALGGALPDGLVVWTGREAIGWGGGCCGDARSDGGSYNPRTNTSRKLPRSPLAPSQGPVGGWDGKELLLFVSGLNPDGRPYPSRYARAAGYNPATNRWRRLAPMPAQGGAATWDGHALLVVGAGSSARQAFAYLPSTNRWRRLAPLPHPRRGPASVWTGTQLVVWGGDSPRGTAFGDAVVYDPGTDTWSALPRSPLRPRENATVVWTGHSLIVWGGVIGTPIGTSIPPKTMNDGASFTPRTR